MIRTIFLSITAYALGVLSFYAFPNIDTKMQQLIGDDIIASMQTTQEHTAADKQSWWHQPIEVDKSLPIPSISLEIEKDPMAWYNAYIESENFIFDPRKASRTAPLPNEWHAHLYVDKVKVGRVYGGAVHIPDSYFTVGETHTITATLNAHTHSDWLLDGEVIKAEVIIDHDRDGYCLAALE